MGNGSFSGEGCIPDTVNNFKTVRELYEHSNHTGAKYSVPVLWDKKEKVIVNNESADIVRILNSAFNKISSKPELDLYPEALRTQIDDATNNIVNPLNGGIYGSGFAKTQAEYEKAANRAFELLDQLEEILSKNRYVCGNQFTEADIKVFVILIRFDEGYSNVFKLTKRRVSDYPNIQEYLRELY